MTLIVRKACCFLANALIVCAIVTFAIGFFPHKAFLPGLATWPADTSISKSSAPFDRIIFMVVDALRSDFVYGNASSFLFVQSLIRTGAAVPLTGHASPPTITMPRVKAITTGSVPSFLDLVLNFAESDTSSTLATQDTWLAQMREKPNGKLVMYGDDTWLRLFPDFFERSDGTTSFFVSDFTDVDNNVTRHVPDELRQNDWNVMVLHFLGLDHIGHKTGPRGPNMPAKQKEMDDIVRMIYHEMQSQQHLQSSILVLLGDHGMNEAGNHGASSAGEVSTALAFISPKLQVAFEGLPSPILPQEDFRFYGEAEQSDVAPTLAALLGFPIPQNSLGIIIPELLELWTKASDRLDILHQNARQIRSVAAATFPEVFNTLGSGITCEQERTDDVERLLCDWKHAKGMYESARKDNATTQQAMIALQKFLKRAQGLLSGAASNYDLRNMNIGTGLAGLATAAAFSASYSTWEGNILTSSSFALVTILHGNTMFASSYVEEEHQFWYWATGGWLAILQFRGLRYTRHSASSIALLMTGAMLLLGIVRRWNQTGQKYVGNPDLVTQVLIRHPLLLWSLVISTYAIHARSLSSRASQWAASKQMTLLPTIICIAAFTFKVAFTAADAPELLNGVGLLRPIVQVTSRYPLVNLARIVFLGIAHLTACAALYETPWKSALHARMFVRVFHDILSLLLITQTRTVNIPLFLLFSAQLILLDKCGEVYGAELTVTSLLLQYSSFFALGGTNAISSVDLSNAYNGVGGYNALAVGVLTFVSNWAGPIWWTSATCRIMASHPSNSAPGETSFRHFTQLTLFITSSTLFVMLACTFLREHLFIWTVFSPKYLYSTAWVVGHHLFINGALGGLLLGP